MARMEIFNFLLSSIDIILCMIDISIIIYFFFYRKPHELNAVRKDLYTIGSDLHSVRTDLTETNKYLQFIRRSVDGTLELYIDMHRDIKDMQPKISRFKMKSNRKFFRKFKNEHNQII